MNNVDIFKILYESNKRKNSTHITIAKPNLLFLQFLVNEFQHVRHQNNNRDLCKKYKMGYDTFKKHFNESLFSELCKNFGDTI